MSPRTLFIEAAYLAASILFILGLRSLTIPDKARRGMQLAALGMLLAIVGTLVHHEVVHYGWILAGLALGSAIGYPLGVYVPMTAMPQRIAISHMFGAVAATLVGVAEYWHLGNGAEVGRGTMAALGFEVLFGALTITGSFMAFGKLQELLPSRPLTFPGQNVVSIAMFAAALGLFCWLVYDPGAHPAAFYAMVALGLAFGISLVLPIGGADMPVVISLLNSYAGLASSATGFAIGNNVLIIAGALDGASGFILSIIMSRAMNRSFTNVLFGAFGSAPPPSAKTAHGLTVRSITPEDAAIQLAFARLVIVVPGYGMAVAQAQHQVRELAQLVEKNGGTVLYAIHPVAGRMPGHMNVLLAEADIPYDKLKEMDEINDEFQNADVALVIGANDVVNPAARNDRSSPIYGMPILDVDRAKHVIVLKRSMNPGFAGIENELFYAENTSMLFGDAKASLAKLVHEVKQQS
ncbi:NAD(P)(+) transhydrogenase (Re/Si-specific) subunit beta [Anaeromyxobacter dehalogenans]|uniref:NAD(P) transhydrogenase subunit beta n=1 Tax=Anaeromyxobacter dehalogenans (strain 2CP-C) TaxID=290397 RepID=Q2IDW8_ANADE|nr:NAD(P)(+) transhydrogenase (Re/Si-specific) subunit beta [Anaeromyxobacter dehalogenans]ABC82777.1 NAD(P) transhydrogenase, beta subunit [Anaeromyxobacter dehalogenans 2CP-C]